MNTIFLAQAPTGTPANANPQDIVLSPNAVPWAIAVIVGIGGMILLFRAQHFKSKAGAASAQPSGDSENFFRNEIARILLNTAIWGLVVLAGLIVIVSFLSPNPEAATRIPKVIFDALLPVFGTWVGTLLAFYFGKANFESGAKVAASAAAADKLQSIPVRNVMIRPERIDTLPDTLLDQPDDKVKLSELVDHLRNKIKRDRIPIFKGNKKTGPAERVLHRSTIEKFVAKQGFAATAANQLKDLNLAQLMADPEFGAVVRAGFAIVKSDSTLADAKTAMDKASAALGPAGNCYDVFVTDTGKADEVVIGWITNDIINENAKV
jgi:hypothetical protein